MGEIKYPTLASMAKKFMSSPATTVPWVRIISNARNTITNKWLRLTPESGKVMIFLCANFKKIKYSTHTMYGVHTVKEQEFALYYRYQETG